MFEIDPQERKLLLEIARKSIEEFLAGREFVPDEPESDILRESCGAFVTLKKGKELRGCIGNIFASEPLYLTVSNMAVSSASRDPRFPVVDANELHDIDIEISALSPFRLIKDIGEIEVGVHGLLIKRSFNQGLLLPQVAEEYGWDRNTFLEHTCRKAGLASDAWKDPDSEIQIFSAVVFGEKNRE